MCDIVVQVCELTPDYDNSGVSAQVAASSAYEIMCLALNNVWDSDSDLKKTKQRWYDLVLVQNTALDIIMLR